MWENTPPNTHIRGKDPIDGIWTSITLDIVGLKILGFYSSVGDHRGMVFDVTSQSLLGVHENRVIRAGSQRLNSKNASSVSRYNEIFEEKVRRHRLRKRLDELDLKI